MAQPLRSYSMALYTLQDDFITVLKGVGAEAKGQIFDGKIELKNDGTQNLTFTVPLYIENNGQVMENPIWRNFKDISNINALLKVKVLIGDISFNKDGKITAIQEGERLFLYDADGEIENTESGQALKIIDDESLSFSDADIFEFLIMSVVENHDGALLTCNVTCESLVFQELGNNGTKLSFSKDDYEVEFSACFDGLVPITSPFYKLENCVQTDFNKNGNSVNLTFTKTETTINDNGDVVNNIYYTTKSGNIINIVDETEFNKTEQKVARVFLNIDNVLTFEEGQKYTLTFDSTVNDNLSFYCPQINTSVLDVKNNNTISFTASKDWFDSFEIVFYGQPSNDEVNVSNFKIVKDEKIFANINYWADKILKGTPWTYEIEMNWSKYDGVEEKTYLHVNSKEYKNSRNKNREAQGLRRMDKIYEDEYVSSWIEERDSQGVITNLIPQAREKFKEKERIIEENESNRYNLLQNLAKKFEVFCRFEYSHDENMRIIGRKVVFYNSLINDYDVIDINYPYDAKNIKRTSDGKDVVTKLYIPPIEDENVLTGSLSIADVAANRSGQDYIYNFDYLYEIGAITDDQYSEVEKLNLKLFEINSKIKNYVKYSSTYTKSMNEQKALNSVAKKRIESLSSEIEEVNNKIISFIGDKTVQKVNGSNYYSTYVVSEKINENLTQRHITISKSGVRVNENFRAYSSPYLLDDSVINFTDILNWKVENDINVTRIIFSDIDSAKLDSHNVIYCQFDYDPYTYYLELRDTLVDALRAAITEEADTRKNIENYQFESEKNNVDLRKLQNEKADLINRFERYMGPAIREGKWEESDYIDNLSYENAILTNENMETEDLKIVFDTVPFDGEQLAYYEYGLSKEKKYYNIIKVDENISNAFNTYGKNLKLIYNDIWKKVNYMYEIDELIKDDDGVLKGVNVSNKETAESIEIMNFDINKNYNKGDLIYISGDMFECLCDNINGIDYSPASYSNVNYLTIGNDIVPAYKEIDGEIVPVLLIINTYLDNIVNARLGTVTTEFEGDKYYLALVANTVVDNIKIIENNSELIYPRIFITNEFINTAQMPEIMINNIKIEPFADFNGFWRYADIENSNDTYTLTIKPEVLFVNGFDFNDFNIKINYQISNGAVSLYLDALIVSKQNAYPQVTYEVGVNIYKEEFIKGLHKFINRIAHINDSQLKFENVVGYISEVTLNLDKPNEDTFSVQNYKTKFEDLFTDIVASAADINANADAYHRAASSFNANGLLDAKTLQDSINNALLTYNLNNGITISKDNGILMENENGAVRLFDGNISIANNKENGEWKWGTAINSNGINASEIKNGHLNTENISIYAGENISLQMNKDGYFAYRTENGEIKTAEFVTHNGDGIFLTNKAGAEYIDNEGKIKKLDKDVNRVEISWDGLILRNYNNENVFYADNDGNLAITGTINANSGSIGDWSISGGDLISIDGSVGLSPNNNQVLWVNNEIDESIFSIDHDGVIRGTSAIFDESVIANDIIVDGVPVSAVIKAVDIEPQIFANILTSNSFKIGVQNDVRIFVSQYGIDGFDFSNVKPVILPDGDSIWNEIKDFSIEERDDGIIYILNNEIMTTEKAVVKFVFENYESEQIELNIENIIFVRIVCESGLISRESITNKLLHAYINANGIELSDYEAMEKYDFQWYANGHIIEGAGGCEYLTKISDAAGQKTITYKCEVSERS